MACGFEHDIQQNEGSRPATATEKGKLTVRFYGNIHRAIDRENLIQLQKFQERFPLTRVMYIHRESFNFSDEDNSELPDLIEALRVALPWTIDTIRISTCSPPAGSCRTDVISPEGHLLEALDGLLDMEYFSNAMSDVQYLLSDIYPISRTPYFGGVSLIRNISPLLAFPLALATDEEQGILFVSDYLNNRIIISDKSGMLIDVVGTGKPGKLNGSASQAEINGPQGLAYVATSRELFFADSRNNKIRKVSLDDMSVSDVFGARQVSEKHRSDLTKTGNSITFPTALTAFESTIYFTCVEGIYAFDTNTQVAKLLCDSENCRAQSIIAMVAVRQDELAIIYYQDNQPALYKNGKITAPLGIPSDLFGNVNGKSSKVRFGRLNALALGDPGIYLSDKIASEIKIWELETGKVNTRLQPPTAPANPGDQNSLTQISALAFLQNGLVAVDAVNGAIYRCEFSSKTWRSIGLSSYETLCYGNFPNIYPIEDADTIHVGIGIQHIDIEISLPNDWHLDPSGITITEVSSTDFAASVNDGDMDSGKVKLRIETHRTFTEGSVTLDQTYYIQADSHPSRQYRVARTIVIPVIADAIMKTESLPIHAVSID